MTSAPYIQPADYAAFGIPTATDAQVAAASRLVNAQLGRPEGLLWSAGADGQPAWMTLRTPTRSYGLPADAVPSDLVAIVIPGASFGQGEVGSAVVIDRVDPTKAETCVVIAASGNTLTLDALRYAHAEGATIEFGLAITEEPRVTYGAMVSTSARPLVRMLAVTGSYRGDRRDRRGGWIDELCTIGTVPNSLLWNPFPLDQCDVDDATGICWLLPGEARGGFARCRVSYIAGWSYANLPAAIKQAVANVIIGQALEPGMGGNIQTLKSGDATITKFRPGALDSDTMALLSPYRNIRI